MANIAYLVSNRPDFAERIKREIGGDPLIVASDGNGGYSEESLAKLADVDALIVAAEPVTEQLFAACGKLKIVQRLGVGYDNVDLEAATRRGIPCCNLAGVNKEAVAEHCMAMILALARNRPRATLRALRILGQGGEKNKPPPIPIGASARSGCAPFGSGRRRVCPEPIEGPSPRNASVSPVLSHAEGKNSASGDVAIAPPRSGYAATAPALPRREGGQPPRKTPR